MSTSPPGATQRTGRGRRPAAEVNAAALSAAGELLFDMGITAVTFDRVAARSGVSRTTLYKRWESPGALAAEAYFTRVEPGLRFDDTGDVEADVRRQLHEFARVLNDPRSGSAVRGLVGAAQSDTALRNAFMASYSLPRRAQALEVLRRGRERGQIRTGFPLEILVDQLWGACYHRILLFDEPLTAEMVDALVTNTFTGARPR